MALRGGTHGHGRSVWRERVGAGQGNGVIIGIVAARQCRRRIVAGVFHGKQDFYISEFTREGVHKVHGLNTVFRGH